MQTIEFEAVDGVAIFRVAGDSLDAACSKAFKQEVNELGRDHPYLVFDMEGLQFVDSSGLGAILSCLRTVSARHGNLVLCSVGRPVQTLLELVRMTRVFDIYPTVEEATRACEQEQSA